MTNFLSETTLVEITNKHVINTQDYISLHMPNPSKNKQDVINLQPPECFPTRSILHRRKPNQQQSVNKFFTINLNLAESDSNQTCPHQELQRQCFLRSFDWFFERPPPKIRSFKKHAQSAHRAKPNKNQEKFQNMQNGTCHCSMMNKWLSRLLSLLTQPPAFFKGCCQRNAIDFRADF